MSSPIDPLSQNSAPVPSPVPANGQAASDDQIRLLAEQINNAGALGFQPATFAKGIVQGIAEGSSSTAPTLSLYLSGDSNTLISGVRFLSTYSPSVGDTVVVMKQGSDLTAFAQYARRGDTTTASQTEGGWTLASLSAGNGHDGNSNGQLMYRRVMDNGLWKMQWKGGITFGGSLSILASPLDAAHSPATKQSLICARDVTNGGGVAVGVDFLANGNVNLVAVNWTTTTTSSDTSSASPGTGQPNGSSGTQSSIETNSHHHSDANHASADKYSGWDTPDHAHLIGHIHTVDSHWHNLNGHYHAANSPTWVSFAGVEYFLG